MEKYFFSVIMSYTLFTSSALHVKSTINSKDCVETEVKRFPDGESFVQILNSEMLRGQRVTVVSSLCDPVNDNLMELIFTIQALKSCGVRELWLDILYLGYARQDRIFQGQPNSIAVVLSMIRHVCGDALVHFGVVDIHCEQSLSVLSDVQVENKIVLPPELLGTVTKNSVIVAPDAGAAKRAQIIAKMCGVEVAIANKVRHGAGVSETLGVIGDLEGKDCIVVDDIVDSANTLCKCAKIIKDKYHPKSLRAFVTHGVLSGLALHNIANSVFDEFVISNSIDNAKKLDLYSKIEVVGKPKFSVVNIFK